MPRGRRVDYPGALIHVGNRGAAKRTVFETREDMRYFLSLVAREVRAGLIEVHAYCLLPNHFHLLLRSVAGRLEDAMRHIENKYVRWFNRRRRRDGALFRGRYFACLVETDVYWNIVVWYIHLNPAKAGLDRMPAHYPHGSSSYMLGGRRPMWLVDGAAADLIRSAIANGAEQPRFEHLARIVERRVAGRDRGPDPLGDLVRTSPARVRDWMVRKARLADGTTPDVRLVHPDTILRLVGAQREQEPDRRLKLSRKSQDLWAVLEAGLLTTASGLSSKEAAARLGCPASTIQARKARHRMALDLDATYAGMAGDTLHEALRMEFGFLEHPAREGAKIEVMRAGE